MYGINSINLNSEIFSNVVENNIINTSEKPVGNSSKVSFDEVINNAINEVNESQVNANNMVESLIKGEDVAMHDVMLAMQESQMSMQLMLEVRNKLVEAYKELNSVQL